MRNQEPFNQPSEDQDDLYNRILRNFKIKLGDDDGAARSTDISEKES